MLHHLELNVNDLSQSFAFYSALTSILGGSRMEKGTNCFWIHGNGFYIYFNPTRAKSIGEFDRYAVGLNHLAFHAASEEVVRAVFQEADARGWTVLDPPGRYGPTYYAVYFLDPSGIKVEVGADVRAEHAAAE